MALYQDDLGELVVEKKTFIYLTKMKRDKIKIFWYESFLGKRRTVYA